MRLSLSFATRILLTAALWSLTNIVFGQQLTYTVDISPKERDSFKVSLQIPDTEKCPSVFQFAATAPGTYQVMDIGRYVSHFEALDRKGKPLKVKKKSVNQWEIENAEKAKQIRYTIAETWDTPVNEHPIYRMCGSSIEQDHALLNGQTIFGYLQGWQSKPFSIKLNYPKTWQYGTALNQDAAGNFTVTSYDHAVDSPILLGRLSKASTQVGNTQVEVYTYSKTDIIKSEALLGHMQQMLQAARAFLVELPVKRYTFLFHFEDRDNGAWEHSYSSEYVMKEAPLTPELADGIVSTAAHEFFHIVTPLNLHSEVIERFNFVNPTGSRHLWLYEGVTEWASDLMQVRAGIKTLDAYLQDLHQKLDFNQYQDTTYSLYKLGLQSFSDSGQAQYNNIYNRGAVTAALLDIRLLELSGGKRGLREVLLELTKKYGPNKPFSEEHFIQEFVQLTYPEVQDFFNRYVLRAEFLPLKEYFGKIGIVYQRKMLTGKKVTKLGMGFELLPGKVVIHYISQEAAACGFKDGDQLATYNNTTVTDSNFMEVFEQIKAKKPGGEYQVTVKRDGKNMVLKCKVLERDEVIEHHFALDPKASPIALKLRESWLKNL